MYTCDLQMDYYEFTNGQTASNFIQNDQTAQPSLMSTTGVDGGLTAREKMSTKPLKYYTDNLFNNNVNLVRGVNYTDGFGFPKDKVDADTYARVGEMTHCNVRQVLSPLPPIGNAGIPRGKADVSIEDHIRPDGIRNRKNCQPRETNFYQRQFQLFDHLPVMPNACVDNYVQKDNSYYMGVDTRNSNTTKYIRK